MHTNVLSAAIIRLCRLYNLRCVTAASRRTAPEAEEKERKPLLSAFDRLRAVIQGAASGLLTDSVVRQQLCYRQPMAVTRMRCLPCRDSFTTQPICPRCEIAFERKHQGYCCRCGQRLDWNSLSKAIIVFPGEK